MKPIPATFRDDGFDFKLLKRKGLVCLFEKSKPTHNRISYEIVVLKLRPEHTWPNGTTTEAHEAMPSSTEWGRYGWSEMSELQAYRRFRDVIERQNAIPSAQQGQKKRSGGLKTGDSG